MNATVRQGARLIAVVAAALSVCFAVCDAARADDVLPAYLEIEEFDPGAVRVVWKVPLNPDVPTHFAPSLPASFRKIPPGEIVNTPTARIEKWTMVGGDETIAGATIGVDGLDEVSDPPVAAEAIEHQGVAGDHEAGGQDGLEPLGPPAPQDRDDHGPAAGHGETRPDHGEDGSLGGERRS